MHVYFSDEDIPRDADLDQIAALRAFRNELESDGLLGTYSDPKDLAGQVVRAVEHDIEDKSWATPIEQPVHRGVNLRWRHDHTKEQKGLDKRGKMTYRTTANRLVASNSGDVDAADLVFAVTWQDGPSAALAPRIDGDRAPVTIHAHSERQWLCIPFHSGNLGISATWSENGHP